MEIQILTLCRFITKNIELRIDDKFCGFWSRPDFSKMYSNIVHYMFCKMKFNSDRNIRWYLFYFYNSVKNILYDPLLKKHYVHTFYYLMHKNILQNIKMWEISSLLKYTFIISISTKTNIYQQWHFTYDYNVYMIDLWLGQAFDLDHHIVYKQSAYMIL